MDARAEHLEALAVRAVRAVPSQADLVAGDDRMADTAVAAYLGGTLAEWTAARRAIDSLFGAGPSPGRSAVQLATAARATEVDDIHLGSCTTPGSVVAASVLALAGAGASRERLRSAVVAGYDAVITLGLLIGGSAALARGIWPTRAAAAIATAMVGAHALELNESQAVHALGIAASTQHAGGVPEPARSLGLGLAVATGLGAAFAASAGMTASAAAIERWCHAMEVGAAVEPPNVAGVRSVCVKPFPSARQSLAPAVIVRAVAEESPDSASRIKHVRVGVPDAHMALVSRRAVTSRLESLASVPYQVALAVTSPTALDDVRRSQLRETADFVQIMDHVDVFADARCNECFPDQWASRIDVETADGTRTFSVTDVPGERELGAEALREKAGRLVTTSGQDRDVVDRLLAACATADYEDTLAVLGAVLQ